MKKALLAILLATAGVAHAEFLDGNTLLSRIESVEPIHRTYAIAYISGAADAAHGIVYCPPENVTAGQLVDMVRKFLVNAPELRAHTADRIVHAVIKTAFPCKAKTPARQPQSLI